MSGRRLGGIPVALAMLVAFIVHTDAVVAATCTVRLDPHVLDRKHRHKRSGRRFLPRLPGDLHRAGERDEVAPNALLMRGNCPNANGESPPATTG